MTTRTVEEAELSDPSTCPEPTRPRTEDEKMSLSDSKQDDALDALTYIRVPTRDPLEIHRWDQSTTMENLAADQVKMWLDEQGAKVLAYRAYGGKLDKADDLAKLRKDIRSTLGADTNPVVAVSVPKVEKNKKDTPPFCTLIKGITPEQVQELLAKVGEATPLHKRSHPTSPPSDLSPRRSPQCSSSHLRPNPPHSQPPSGVSSSSTNLTSRLRTKSRASSRTPFSSPGRALKPPERSKDSSSTGETTSPP